MAKWPNTTRLQFVDGLVIYQDFGAQSTNRSVLFCSRLDLMKINPILSLNLLTCLFMWQWCYFPVMKCVRVRDCRIINWKSIKTFITTPPPPKGQTDIGGGGAETGVNLILPVLRKGETVIQPATHFISSETIYFIFSLWSIMTYYYDAISIFCDLYQSLK